MANKRVLKKQIKYICGDLAAECILASKTIPNIDSEKMYNLIYDVAELQTNTLQRTSFGFDKSAKDFSSNKEYKKARNKYYTMAFRTMSKDFNEKVADIVKGMNALRSEAKTGAPKKEVTKKEALKKEVTKKEAPKKEVAKKEVTKKEAAKKETTKKEAAKKETTKKEAAKKETTKKEATKKETTKKTETKKATEKKPVAKKTTTKKTADKQ